MAAALRKIPKHILGKLSNQSSFVPSSSLQFSPSLFISRRGFASKLFVKGLSFHTTEEGLLDAFSQYGQVVEAKVVMDKVSDRSKGFGFVTFASVDEAEKAKMEMDGKALHGRVIMVEYAKPRRYDDGGMPIARGPPEPITNL